MNSDLGVDIGARFICHNRAHEGLRPPRRAHAALRKQRHCSDVHYDVHLPAIAMVTGLTRFGVKAAQQLLRSGRPASVCTKLVNGRKYTKLPSRRRRAETTAKRIFETTHQVRHMRSVGSVCTTLPQGRIGPRPAERHRAQRRECKSRVTLLLRGTPTQVKSTIWLPSPPMGLTTHAPAQAG